MIVASIRNGFQPHAVGLSGLGCADCSGSCGKFTGGPIGPAKSHIHALMGLGFCGDGEAATCPFASQLYSTSLDPRVASNPNPIYAVGSPQWLDITGGGSMVVQNVQSPVQPQGVIGVDPTAQIIVPVNTQVAQTAQQQVQSNGIVATPVVAPTSLDTSSTGIIQSNLNPLFATVFGIPLWMILGVGALALAVKGES